MPAILRSSCYTLTATQGWRGAVVATSTRSPAPPYVIGPDVTAAIGRCDNCGRTEPMAEVRVFDTPPA